MVGSPIGACATASAKRRRNSSCTVSCTITVPSDVQRWPAVPKPLNSAPSTARSSSASSMTTSGFLPPSSRHGDCRWRPHRAPISRPTSDEPVKPTLSTRRSSRARSRPANVCAPSARTRFSTPSGTPPCRNSCASASPSAGAYSAGFHTTALPHRRAGTRYHAGTATGKLPAVITATTPTGVRKVNSCLSGISDGTVCPYSRRPSDRKKSQVSTTSWTSPSDSVYGLPISRVTSRASASLFRSTRRPTFLITPPRTGAGTRSHCLCAARAARQAAAKPAASESSISATTSSRCAGLRDSTRRPVSATVAMLVAYASGEEGTAERPGQPGGAGAGERDRSAGAPANGDRLDAVVARGEAVLVALAAAEEAVLAHTGVHGLLDRVRQQDQADRGALPVRVAPRLVVRLGAPEAEPVPGGHGVAIRLGQPEAKPAALESHRGEALVERRPGPRQRLGALIAPAGLVQANETAYVGREARGVVAEPEAEPVLALELPPLPPELRAEVPAAPGQVLLPATRRP